MDPLTVLGLASNVIQLLDAAANAFTICHEIYKMGSSIEDSRMAYTSDQLYRCYFTLNDSLKKEAVAGSKILSGGVVLQDLGLQCCETAGALHAELESLRKSPGGFRETVSIAIMKRRKAKKIAQLKARLDEYQKVLDSRVLMDIRHDGRFDETEQRLAQVSVDLARCHIPVSDQFKADIDWVVKVSEKQHESTREHIETHVTTALRDLEMSHAQERGRDAQARISQQAIDQFLKSLTFDDINLRMNEIVGTHAKVFEWIFDEEKPGPWDSFAAWLRSNEQVYWINGKAGSGKSTLMKFIAGNSKTKEFLMNWSPDARVLIVTHYFWVSGSTLQRSMKGFPCSVIRQLVLADNSLPTRLVDIKDRLYTKSNLGDWSTKELQQLLITIIDSLDYSVCILVDGLDEFDQSDDVDNLLDIIIRLSVQKKIKLCLSSRPEYHLVKRLSRYRCLRLQDLTAEDLKICVQSELEMLRTRHASEIFDEVQLSRLVEVMTRKADGVFLWVHFVLQSIARGIRKEDNFEDLLSRIEEFPSEMQQLYSQMWKRLNGDESRYRQEAAEYFSWVILSRNLADSLSLFELWVVLDVRLQDHYIKSITPQNPAVITEGCERLRSRILTRCAGLLEIKTTEQELSHDRNIDKLMQPAAYCKMSIKFIHRTAQDFMTDTEAGKDLMGKPTASCEVRLGMIIKARMAALVQKLQKFICRSIDRIMFEIAYNCLEQEKALLIILEDVCAALSDRMVRRRCVTRPEFWKSHYYYCEDFVGAAAHFGCLEYIRDIIENKTLQLSSTYLGYLFFCAAFGLRSATLFYTRQSYLLSTISYLASQGVDLISSHGRSYQYSIGPRDAFLYNIINPVLLEVEDEDLWKQVVQIVQQLLPSLVSSADEIPVAVALNRGIGWRCTFDHPVWMRLGDQDLIVYMSIAQLCDLIMRCIELRLSYKPQWIRPATDDKQPLRITAFMERCVVESKYYDVAAGSGYKLSNEDSKLCGRILERVLFREDQSAVPDSELAEELLSTLDEACRRSLYIKEEFDNEAWLNASTLTGGMSHDDKPISDLVTALLPQF